MRVLMTVEKPVEEFVELHFLGKLIGDAIWRVRHGSPTYLGYEEYPNAPLFEYIVQIGPNDKWYYDKENEILTVRVTEPDEEDEEEYITEFDFKVWERFNF